MTVKEEGCTVCWQMPHSLPRPDSAHLFRASRELLEMSVSVLPTQAGGGQGGLDRKCWHVLSHRGLSPLKKHPMGCVCVCVWMYLWPLGIRWPMQVCFYRFPLPWGDIKSTQYRATVYVLRLWIVRVCVCVCEREQEERAPCVPPRPPNAWPPALDLRAFGLHASQWRYANTNMPPANKGHTHTHQTVSLLIAFSNFNIFIVCGMVVLNVIWKITFTAWIRWLMPTDSFILCVCWRLMAPTAELWWLLTMFYHICYDPQYIDCPAFLCRVNKEKPSDNPSQEKCPNTTSLWITTHKHHKQFIRVVWGPHTSKKPLKVYSEGLFPYEQCLFSCSLMRSLPALSHLQCLTRPKESVGSVSRVSLKFCQQP